MVQHAHNGFTLIELALAIAILTILSAFAIPKFAENLRRSREAVTKCNLATLRVCLVAYRIDHDDKVPHDNLQGLVTGGYIDKIPMIYTWHHPTDNSCDWGTENARRDSTESLFLYDNFGKVSEPKAKTLIVNCNHRDMSGRQWDTQ